MKYEKFDYSKLRGKIIEVYKTQNRFAASIGLTSSALSQRLNNHLNFSPKEIFLASINLGIDRSEIGIYFFDLKVQKNEQKVG